MVRQVAICWNCNGGLSLRFMPWTLTWKNFSSARHGTTFGNRSVVALSPEDLLLSLGVHAAKHAWIRLCWLRDVAGVVQSTALNWACVWQEARRLGIERILTINLRLANMLLGAGASQSEQQRDHPEIIAISDRIAAEMPSAEEYSTESLEYFRLMLRLRERRSDRVRFALRLLFTPSVGEWSVVRLPGPLFPLYRLIRLFRVAARFLRMGGAQESLAREPLPSNRVTFRIYFTVTSATFSSGYSWFHCEEMLSKVSRKGLLCPGASGDTLTSTASG